MRMSQLNPRQQTVLWATVRQYVATAEPVGSKSLSEEYNLNVSPATIRNAMGMLEKSGFLYQPHTSAGRVPSDSGYRLYVDQLMQPAEKLAQKVDQRLTAQLDWDGWSLEALLKGAAQILATLSGYITLVTLPQATQARLRHLQLVQIEPGKVLLVAVLDAYGTQSVLVELAPDGTPVPDVETMDRELQILSNFLNSQLRGQALGEVAGLDWDDLGLEFQRYSESLRGAIAGLTQRRQSPMSAQFMVSGLAEVLRQPEFAEIHQVQTLFHLLEEEQDQLWPLMFDPPIDLAVSDGRVRVWIGSENPLEPMQGCALVSANYHKDSQPVGSVGMLGPTRMIYENAVVLVEATADYLSDKLK